MSNSGHQKAQRKCKGLGFRLVTSQRRVEMANALNAKYKIQQNALIYSLKRGCFVNHKAVIPKLERTAR